MIFEFFTIVIDIEVISLCSQFLRVGGAYCFLLLCKFICMFVIPTSTLCLLMDFPSGLIQLTLDSPLYISRGVRSLFKKKRLYIFLSDHLFYHNKQCRPR